MDHSLYIKDGSEIRFWEDKWLGNATLREQFPIVYNIVYHKGELSPRFWNPFRQMWRPKEI